MHEIEICQPKIEGIFVLSTIAISLNKSIIFFKKSKCTELGFMGLLYFLGSLEFNLLLLTESNNWSIFRRKFAVYTASVGISPDEM